jgi:hypothetical protein
LKNHQLIGSKVTAALFPDIPSFKTTKTPEKGKLLIEINSVVARIQLAAQALA